MVLNLVLRPVGGKSNSGRMQDVFANCQFRQNYIILGDVSNGLFVSEEFH